MRKLVEAVQDKFVSNITVPWEEAKIVQKSSSYAFPIIVIPYLIEDRTSYDGIAVTLWGGTKWSWGVKYQNVSKNIGKEFSVEDFDGDEDTNGHTNTLSKKDFLLKAKKSINNSDISAECESFLREKLSKVWGSAEIEFIGKGLDKGLMMNLVDSMARYFEMK